MIIDDLHKLIKQNSHFYIENEQIDVLGSEKYVDIVIDERHVENDSLSFKNVTFLQKVELSKFTLTGILNFSNCIFANGIVLSEIHSNSLALYNCRFQGNNTIKISQHCVFGGISEIASCGKLRSLIIMNTKFSHLIVSDCEIEHQYFLRHNDFDSEFRLEKNTFPCQIRQESNNFGSFVAMQNTFKRDLFFKDSRITNSLSIIGNLFEEEVTIDPFDKVGSDSSLTLTDNIFRRTIRFGNYHLGGCKKIYIGSNIFDSGLSISGESQEIETPYVEKIDLVLSNTNEGLIKISDLDIKELNISGENYKGNIILRNLRSKDLKLSSFANYSNFQFINLQPFSNSSSFIITESHLEKVQFVNSRLDNFDSYIIENSNLSLIKSANTKWFDYNQIALNARVIGKFEKGTENGLRKVFTDTKENIYLEVREIFRQLKYAMDQQGDRVESLKFRSYEMEAYFRYLQISKRRLNIDRLILFLGKSNEHGINWVRPLMILFVSTLIFYVALFYAASPSYVFGYGHQDVKHFLIDLWQFKKIIPQMFNPTHQIEKMFTDNYQISGYLQIFDLMYKIIFSYLAFQTISAFRKFIK